MSCRDKLSAERAASGNCDDWKGHKCRRFQVPDGANTSFHVRRWMISETFIGTALEGPLSTRTVTPRHGPQWHWTAQDRALRNASACQSFTVRHMIQVSLTIVVRETWNQITALGDCGWAPVRRASPASPGAFAGPGHDVGGRTGAGRWTAGRRHAHVEALTDETDTSSYQSFVHADRRPATSLSD